MLSPPDNRSVAQRLADDDALEDMIDSLTPQEQAELSYHWPFWARQNQLLPPGNWKTWMILAGRGAGKTRTLSETVKIWSETNAHIGVVGATADDVNAVVVDGDSGILAIFPKHERPIWQKTYRRLVFHNGCRVQLFSADAPERLRGRQFHKLAFDELASWGASGAGGSAAATAISSGDAGRYTFDMAMMGLRLGSKPQVVISTTPRPIPLISDILKHPRTVITRGSTMDNSANLAPDFIESVLDSYGNTRLGRQEIYGELLGDTPGALWTPAMIEAANADFPIPDNFDRVVVAVDPSGAGSAAGNHDAIGIIAAGAKMIGKTQHFWILDDHTLTASPDAWARAALDLADSWDADRLVAEVNFGGAMVESVLRSVNPNVPFRAVTASRGKVARAEPVAALYEQGRVHHYRHFPDLERQMEAFTTSGFKGRGSPDRVDACVWAVMDLLSKKRAPIVGGVSADSSSYWLS